MMLCCRTMHKESFYVASLNDRFIRLHKSNIPLMVLQSVFKPRQPYFLRYRHRVGVECRHSMKTVSVEATLARTFVSWPVLKTTATTIGIQARTNSSLRPHCTSPLVAFKCLSFLGKYRSKTIVSV